MSLHVVFEPPNGPAPTVDFVAIHGLNFLGSPKPGTSTWEQDGKLWIRDFLPQHLSTTCRVMLYEYNSSPAVGAAAFTLGGLLIKEALVEATLDTSYREVLGATKLLVFFGTPHQGGNLTTVGDYAAKIYRSVARDPRNDMVESLRATSEIATKRYEQFRHQLENFRVISCYEGLPYSKLTGLIVDKRSATLNLPGSREKQIGINADHSAMCKFASAQQADCELVMGVIEDQLEIAMVQFTDMNQLLRRLEYPNRRAREAQIWNLSSNVDTFAWIWSSPFARWLSSHEKIFWIRGKPASGKSTLINYIASDSRTEEQVAMLFSKHKAIIITFCFDFRQGTTTANSLKGMLLTIAYVLAQEVSGLAASLRLRYPNWQKIYSNDAWDATALYEIIRYSFAEAKLPVCLFIDGLDEFSGDSKEQLDLAVRLEQLVSSDQVKLCFASRPHNILEQKFGSRKRLEMQDWNQPGLRNYFFSTFHDMQLDNDPERASQTARLSQLLAEMAEGVFLWAKFAADIVVELWAENNLAFDTLLIRVAKLPKEVEAFWDERRRKLTDAERHAGNVLLRVACSAARPLSVPELLGVLKHQVRDADSLGLLKAASKRVVVIDRLSCGLLNVEVEKYGGKDNQTKILLVHKSVRSYLDERGWWLASEDELSPERLWFIECVDFIKDGTWALQRALCYRNAVHDVSNPVCKSYGCYATYPIGCFPSSLLEELHSSTSWIAVAGSISPAVLKSAWGLRLMLAMAVRRKTFFKRTARDQPLADYALLYTAYHAWLLQQRRNIECLADTNLIMCPELIILMSEGWHGACPACESSRSLSRGSGRPLSFHGTSVSLTGLVEGPPGMLSFAVEDLYVRYAVTDLSVSIMHNPWARSGTSNIESSIREEGSALAGAVRLMHFNRSPPRSKANVPKFGLKPKFVRLSETRTRKIAVVGLGRSGKSSLVLRFVGGRYYDSYRPTIETVFTKIIRYKGLDYVAEIVDTQAEDEYTILNSQHFIGVHGYMIVYSVDSKQTFDMCRIIHEKILNHIGAEDVPTMIVGNKAEVGLGQRRVTTEDGKKLAQELGGGFVEVDSTNNVNVAMAFQGMIALIEKGQEPERYSNDLKCSLM
ncbi:GTP-binding protein [Elasticomyces elasticus]|nr:GTP-binding protein [Elasticomyces elasticus]